MISSMLSVLLLWIGSLHQVGAFQGTFVFSATTAVRQETSTLPAVTAGTTETESTSVTPTTVYNRYYPIGTLAKTHERDVEMARMEIMIQHYHNVDPSAEMTGYPASSHNRDVDMAVKLIMGGTPSEEDK